MKKTIPNTNIIHLVRYILYPEHDDEGDDDMSDKPPGFGTFLEGLESQWVRDKYVIDQLDNNENEWDTTDDEEDDGNEDDDEDDDKSDDNENDDDDDTEEDSQDEKDIGDRDDESDSEYQTTKKKNRAINWKSMSSSCDGNE